MHFDFRPLLRKTFAELSQQYPYSHTPASSWGRIEGKATQGPWCLALAKAHFWKLGCCIWFGCREASPLEARLLPMKGKVSKSTTTQGAEPEPNRNSPAPFSYLLLYRNDYNFAKLSRTKMLLSRTRKKIREGT
jgi:hypothetical protein